MKTCLIKIFLLCCFLQAKADEWPAPVTKIYYNSDSTCFVRIIPAVFPKKYREWLKSTEEQKKHFLPEDTVVVPCHALMYQKTKKNERLLWEADLINTVAPVSAIVSEKGDYLATFDNWYSTGFGTNVIVFYDNNGRLIRTYKLEDVSPFPLVSYSRSVSSLQWRCGAKFIGRKRIEICFMTEKKIQNKQIFNLKNRNGSVHN